MSRISNPLVFRPAGADWKSAAQQVGNLRYGDARLPGHSKPEVLNHLTMKPTFSLSCRAAAIVLACALSYAPRLPAAEPKGSDVPEKPVPQAAVPACCPADQAACCPSDAKPSLSAEVLKEKWGIEIASLRTSMNGHMIDFRYKVLDANKAVALADEESKALLIDEATGRKLLVPTTPKAGPLRPTTEHLKVGRVYYALFRNPGKTVKAGSKVTIVIGDFRAEHLTVK